jgi:hypothetical protein
MVTFQFHQQAETNKACLLLEIANLTIRFDLSYLFTTSKQANLTYFVALKELLCLSFLYCQFKVFPNKAKKVFEIYINIDGFVQQGFLGNLFICIKNSHFSSAFPP